MSACLEVIVCVVVDTGNVFFYAYKLAKQVTACAVNMFDKDIQIR